MSYKKYMHCQNTTKKSVLTSTSEYTLPERTEPRLEKLEKETTRRPTTALVTPYVGRYTTSLKRNHGKVNHRPRHSLRRTVQHGGLKGNHVKANQRPT